MADKNVSKTRVIVSEGLINKVKVDNDTGEIIIPDDLRHKVFVEYKPDVTVVKELICE